MKTLTRRTVALAAGAAAAALLMGCAPAQVNGLGVVPRANFSVKGTCPFGIAAIEDRRDEKRLGFLFLTRVDGDAFPAWLAESLQATPGYTAQGAPLSLRVEVLKAYVHSIGEMKTANIVLRVHASAEGEAPRTKLYRGVDKSIAWTTSEPAIQAAFYNAMEDLQEQLATDLAKTCNQ